MAVPCPVGYVIIVSSNFNFVKNTLTIKESAYFFSTLETGYNGTDLLTLFPLFFLHCSHAYGSQLRLKLNFYVVTLQT